MEVGCFDVDGVAVGDEQPGGRAGEGTYEVNVAALDGLAEAGDAVDGGVQDGAEDGFEVAKVETVGVGVDGGREAR